MVPTVSDLRLLYLRGGFWLPGGSILLGGGWPFYPWHRQEHAFIAGIFSSPAGLLNLEKLLRQFLISKDTLSVRMLDDSRDPTPLLKEIRDDKTATIIIHANASMSHTILLKVSSSMSVCVMRVGDSQLPPEALAMCVFHLELCWAALGLEVSGGRDQ